MSSLTALAPYRPILITVAVASLAFAFGRSGGHPEGSDCDRDKGRGASGNSILLGIGLLVTVGLIGSSWLFSAPENDFNASTGAFEEVTFDIERMTCSSCTTTVLIALERAGGVVDAQVSFVPPQATVRYDPARTTERLLSDVITNTGYPARRSDAGYVARSASDELMRSDGLMQSHVDPMSPITPDALRAAFNNHSDQVRLVAILSPTCPQCIHGHEVIRQLFDRFESTELSAMIAWIPMKPNDSAAAATAQALTFTDERVRLEGWDTDRAIGGAFEKTLGLTRTAWDVYMVYDPGVTWSGALPPAPSYWMHQLTGDSGADQRYCLSPTALAGEIGKRLARVES